MNLYVQVTHLSLTNFDLKPGVFFVSRMDADLNGTVSKQQSISCFHQIYWSHALAHLTPFTIAPRPSSSIFERSTWSEIPIEIIQLYGMLIIIHFLGRMHGMFSEHTTLDARADGHTHRRS